MGGFVTVADRGKRFGKWSYKTFRGTQGANRDRAAIALLVGHYADAGPHIIGGRNAATLALAVILGEEFERVVASRDHHRLADRLKSN